MVVTEEDMVVEDHVVNAVKKVTSPAIVMHGINFVIIYVMCD